MIRFAQDRGWKLHSPFEVEQRGGSVMIEVDQPAAFVSSLAERDVFVDCRPGVGLRMSPHFFNTDEEVESALAMLADLM